MGFLNQCVELLDVSIALFISITIFCRTHNIPGKYIRIYFGIMSFSQNIVMEMNNVMSIKVLE